MKAVAARLPVYQSPLREAQAQATSQQILAAVALLIESGAEPTYAAIAKQAGVQERTVYRHFPTKDDLYEKFWWTVVDARLGRTGYEASTLDEMMRDVEATFLAFDANAALVTEMLHSRHGLAIRMRTNDRRTAMFERIARSELPGVDGATRRRAAAVAQLMYSGAAWHTLRAYWGMDAREAVASVGQMLRAMFAGLRRGAGVRRRKAHGHGPPTEKGG